MLSMQKKLVTYVKIIIKKIKKQKQSKRKWIKKTKILIKSIVEHIKICIIIR